VNRVVPLDEQLLDQPSDPQLLAEDSAPIITIIIIIIFSVYRSIMDVDKDCMRLEYGSDSVQNWCLIHGTKLNLGKAAISLCLVMVR
jgi:hypothetical protein